MKRTKSALLSSVVTLLLCFTMLIGTTFAWFTDSVTSGNNKIVAGNLDVELYTGDGMDVEVDENTMFFDNITWEPGVVAYENLKVANVGSLAFLYNLSINIGGHNTLDGKSLKDVLKIAVVEDTTFTKSVGRAGVLDAVAQSGEDFVLLTDYAANGELYPENNADNHASEKTMAIVIYWEPSDSDNDYNVNNGKATSDGDPLYVNLGINLFATQYTYESDSFGNTYDEAAVIEVTDMDALEAALLEAKDGDVFLFSDDFAVTKQLTISKDVTFYFGNNKVTGMSVLLDDATVTLSAATSAGIDVAGNGGLVLSFMDVQAEDGDSAIALAEGAKVAVVVENEVTAVAGKGGDGIEVPAGAELDLSGDKLTVIANNGAEYVDETYKTTEDETYKNTVGSGIGNAGAEVGAITIHDMDSLTAAGYGQNAFGIGGNTAALTIADTTIEYVRGGCARSVSNDTSYAKDGEGGAAIGTSVDGGKVTLNNVTVNHAEGGAKSAAIGGFWHTDVTVEITGSSLNNIIGGHSAAAIGGGRVGGDEGEGSVSVVITDSTITNVQGGYFGAGIGSGYDTDCAGNTTTDIVIKGTTVIANVTGGARAAGIGTGYHNPLLTGSIDGTVTLENVVSGEKYYKDGYFYAQDIGYGVADPRDGAGRGYENYLNTVAPSFTVNGAAISYPAIAPAATE